MNIPQTGYVGVGTVLAPAERFEDARVLINGSDVPLSTQPLEGGYTHHGAEADDDAEWVAPIQWIRTVPKASAYWEKGLFANQNSACKLRQEFTLEQLARRFDVNSDDE